MNELLDIHGLWLVLAIAAFSWSYNSYRQSGISSKHSNRKEKPNGLPILKCKPGSYDLRDLPIKQLIRLNQKTV